MNHIWVVHEIEGGSVLHAFECESDARSFLHWGEFRGEILPRHYTVSQVRFMGDRKK